ncbi:MAG: hypothetical protein A3D65_03845 [Candidatus Lloydbacteria bacterium RIFCSPHIGHO2_02_FULL_50_13]|uniref:SpoVT-AbrB domain-containing protein n=1 Tax=Candidatus Lloydbacteria bacterium RIFCSPHIGHO2_02_FULL_50_13 TaxID=1798661 RepID=A0A1G2D4E8_9BACT|nr:MAG: hypothetical protein A3D65_03845 [Candidatus Lloydbacteria bacterium RIFCSPHIGHO2_02_FULL_50_13]
MNITEKIQRVTERGQITLPIAWRRKMGTSAIVLKTKGDTLEITPLATDDERDEQWVTIFDAARDNGGVGIPAEEMIATLKKLAKKKKLHGRTR